MDHVECRNGLEIFVPMRVAGNRKAAGNPSIRNARAPRCLVFLMDFQPMSRTERGQLPSLLVRPHFFDMSYSRLSHPSDISHTRVCPNPVDRSQAS